MSCKAGFTEGADLKPKFGQTHVLNIGIDDTVIVNVVHTGNDRIKTTTIFRPLGISSETGRFDNRISFKTDWSVESSDIIYK